jgi:hypothetical protein
MTATASMVTMDTRLSRIKFVRNFVPFRVDWRRRVNACPKKSTYFDQYLGRESQESDNLSIMARRASAHFSGDHPDGYRDTPLSDAPRTDGSTPVRDYVISAPYNGKFGMAGSRSRPANQRAVLRPAQRPASRRPSALP